MLIYPLLAFRNFDSTLLTVTLLTLLPPSLETYKFLRGMIQDHSILICTHTPNCLSHFVFLLLLSNRLFYLFLLLVMYSLKCKLSECKDFICFVHCYISSNQDIVVIPT